MTMREATRPKLLVCWQHADSKFAQAQLADWYLGA